MIEAITNFFDRYSRVARLFPALLAVAPLLWTVAVLKPGVLVDGSAHMAGSAILFFASCTLLANIARSRGKAAETKLLKIWGGWRTTALLRHRDPTLDAYTKARYHTQLQVHCPGLTLPTAVDESTAPDDADARYRSATMRLLELRREPKYKLLHKENAQYGFRRNLFGLKPVAILLALLALAVSAAIGIAGYTQTTVNGAALFADVAKRWPVYAVGIADILYSIGLALVLRPAFVRQAADEYALALFRTLE